MMKANFTFLWSFFFFALCYSQPGFKPKKVASKSDVYACVSHPYEPFYTQEHLLDILRRDRENSEKVKYFEAEIGKKNKTITENTRLVESIKQESRIYRQMWVKKEKEKQQLEKRLERAIFMKDEKIKELQSEIGALGAQIQDLKNQVSEWVNYSKLLEKQVLDLQRKVSELERERLRLLREIEKLQRELTEHGSDVFIPLHEFWKPSFLQGYYSLKKETNIKLSKFKKKRNRRLNIDIYYYALPEEFENGKKIVAKACLLPPYEFYGWPIFDNLELHDYTLDKTGGETDFEEIARQLGFRDVDSKLNEGRLFKGSFQLEIPPEKNLTTGTYYIGINVNNKIMVKRRFTLY